MSGRGVDPVFSTTTPIRYRNEKGGGTGFFFNYEGRSYLVTNRHVVDPDDEDVNPTEADIWLRNQTNVGQVQRNPIRLSKDDSPRWKGHPDSSDVDLAIIPINPRLSTLDDLVDENSKVRSGNLAFTPEYLIHENVQADQRVSIVGYPGDFFDRKTRFPIRRNALISTPYRVGFEGNPYFLTDARMHPGTSGSPVVMETGGMSFHWGDVPDNREKRLYLLGIHSATFYGTEYEEHSQQDGPEDIEADDQFRLDLNVAWYPSLLLDIFDSL